MHQIRVINSNDREFSDRFDGVPYNFPPAGPKGKGTSLPLDAAAHIFGVEFPSDPEACAGKEFRDAVFRHLQRRWGWNSHEKSKAKAGETLFRKLAFVPVELKTVELAVKHEALPLPRGDDDDLIEDADAVEKGA